MRGEDVSLVQNPPGASQWETRNELSDGMLGYTKRSRRWKFRTDPPALGKDPQNRRRGPKPVSEQRAIVQIHFLSANVRA